MGNDLPPDPDTIDPIKWYVLICHQWISEGPPFECDFGEKFEICCIRLGIEVKNWLLLGNECVFMHGLCDTPFPQRLIALHGPYDSFAEAALEWGDCIWI